MTNDKIAEIRARHAQSEKNYIELEATWKAQVHEDRAWLLAEVERLTREISEARAELKASSCDYPDCVDLGQDGKCTKWLLGECNPTLGAKP